MGVGGGKGVAKDGGAWVMAKPDLEDDDQLTAPAASYMLRVADALERTIEEACATPEAKAVLEEGTTWQKAMEARVDISGLSAQECKAVAADLFFKIAESHGENEARRIHHDIDRLIPTEEIVVEENELLRLIYALPPPLGGNIKRMARDIT